MHLGPLEQLTAATVSLIYFPEKLPKICLKLIKTNTSAKKTTKRWSNQSQYVEILMFQSALLPLQLWSRVLWHLLRARHSVTHDLERRLQPPVHGSAPLAWSLRRGGLQHLRHAGGFYGLDLLQGEPEDGGDTRPWRVNVDVRAVHVPIWLPVWQLGLAPGTCGSLAVLQQWRHTVAAAEGNTLQELWRAKVCCIVLITLLSNILLKCVSKKKNKKWKKKKLHDLPIWAFFTKTYYVIDRNSSHST